MCHQENGNCFASWKLGRIYSKLRSGLAKERGPRGGSFEHKHACGCGMWLSCVLLGLWLGVTWRQLGKRHVPFRGNVPRMV